MKRQLLTVALATAFFAHAQTTIYSENFDGLNADDYVGTQSSDWTTWSGTTGGSEDAMVSNEQSASPSNSVKIDAPNGQGPTDLLLPFNDYTTGIYELNFNIYVVGQNGGYFNIQKTSTAGEEWAMEVFFDATSGGGTVNAGGQDAAMFQYTQDTWTEVSVYMNLDADSAALTIAGQLVHTWQYSLTATGEAGRNQLGGLNIFGAAPSGQSALYYFDDVVLTQLASTGLNELSSSINTFPNPTFGEVFFQLPSNANQVDYAIYDLLGNKIKEEKALAITGNNFKVDFSNYAAGMYIIETKFNHKRTVNKITVK